LISPPILNIFNRRLDHSIRLIEANLMIYSSVGFDIELMKLGKFLDKIKII